MKYCRSHEEASTKEGTESTKLDKTKWGCLHGDIYRLDRSILSDFLFCKNKR